MGGHAAGALLPEAPRPLRRRVGQLRLAQRRVRARGVFAEWGIAIENLPPNMTDLLQVMDLVVNGPIKADIRRAHIQAIFDYFQSWKIRRLPLAACYLPLATSS